MMHTNVYVAIYT